MINDYRATKYCPKIIDLANKKKLIADKIREAHPRARDMHTFIRANDKEYKVQFMKGYNFKCAYCGSSIDILPKEMFEIDHFICVKSFPNKAAAGYIENLVLSCYSCNHQKRAFELLGENEEFLHPDGDKIQETFKRDEEYYIKVSESHKDNELVVNFYNQIGLGGEIHRLDYLLMNMIGLQRKLKDNPVAYAIFGQAIEKLRQKRNIM